MKDVIRDFRTDHYLRIKNNVVDDYLGRIGMAGFAVYGVLCRYAGNKTQRSCPSQQTIADVINCSPTTVRKALKTLETCKLISVKKKGKAGHYWHEYSLLEAAKIKGKAPSKSEGASESEGAPSKSEGAGSKSDGILDVDSRRETKRESASQSATQKEPTKKQAADKNTCLPEDFQPSEENQQLCTKRALVLSTVLEKFRAHAADKGRRSKDWQAALTKWILGERTFGKGNEVVETPEEELERRTREHRSRYKRHRNHLRTCGLSPYRLQERINAEPITCKQWALTPICAGCLEEMALRQQEQQQRKAVA